MVDCLGKIYIAGPMNGYPDCNFPAFDAAKKHLTSLGWEVISPADMDRRDGFDGKGEIPPHFSRRQRMKVDLPIICDCTAIAVLPGWLKSKGARLEVHLAQVIGLPTFEALTGLPVSLPEV